MQRCRQQNTILSDVNIRDQWQIVAIKWGAILEDRPNVLKQTVINKQHEMVVNAT
jgi:hypothetical protein